MSTEVITPTVPSATPPPSRADTPVAQGYLLIEQSEKRQAGQISGRVIIGRRTANHIVIPDRSIARIHAWISAADGHHVLYDTGSRIGTQVNKRRVQGKHILQDGDTIRLGPATIYYRTDPAAIAGADPIDLTDRPLSTNRPDDGQFVDCNCGAPLWVPWDFAGKMGQCRYCNQTVVVQPRTPTPSATPPAQRADNVEVEASTRPQTKKTKTCGICHSPIADTESKTQCPSCHNSFHEDCWTENHGCASYGCAQVNILEQSHEPLVNGEIFQPAISEVQIPDSPAEIGPGLEPTPLPWEFLLLAAAVLGSIIGVWTFGIPAVAVAAGSAIGLNKRPRHRPILLVALAFAILGAVAGVGLSYFWWIASKHTGMHHA